MTVPRERSQLTRNEIAAPVGLSPGSRLSGTVLRRRKVHSRGQLASSESPLKTLGRWVRQPEIGKGQREDRLRTHQCAQWILSTPV
jgi:hypothetical protein